MALLNQNLVFLWLFHLVLDSGDSIIMWYNIQLNCTACSTYFCWISCLTENIFKNHTGKCSRCHIGTQQVNISDYFILVMPRPFEKCILEHSFHEIVIYVVVATFWTCMKNWSVERNSVNFGAKRTLIHFGFV